jgi:hypothetical protein
VNGCANVIGIGVLTLLGLVVLNFFGWFLFTVTPYAVILIFVIAVIARGFGSRRYW